MLIIKLALRNLFRNVRRTVLTMMLIGFSLTALIVAEGTIAGMLKLMVESMTDTISGEAQIHQREFLETFDADLYMTNVDSLRQQLDQDPNIRAYAVRTMAGGMISSSYNLVAGMILGIDPEAERQVSKISQALVSGEYLKGQPHEILLGDEMAKSLEIELGDRVVVTVSQVNGGELGQALFRLSGTFHFGLRELDSSFAFISLPRGQELLGLGNNAHEIVLQFHQPEAALAPQNLAPYTNEQTEALNWMQVNPEIGSIVEMVDYSAWIVAAILFLLASLGVINSMFMSIYERIYEFGVAKAIGTRPSELTLLIVCEAALLAALSVTFGLIVGLGLNYYLSVHGLPMGNMEMSGIAIQENVFTSFTRAQFVDFPIFVVVLTMVASLYPARFAARIVPTEALHRSL